MSDSVDIDSNNGILTLGNRLLSLLAIKNNTVEDATDLIIDFFSMLITDTEFTKFTREEIIEAYKLAIKGELLDENGNSIKLFRELNYISAVPILRAYKRYFNKELSNLTSNQKLFIEKEKPRITEAEKEESYHRALNTLIDCIKKGIPCNLSEMLIFEYLESKQIINQNNEWEQYLEKGKKAYRDSLLDERKQKISFGRGIEINKIIQGNIYDEKMTEIYSKKIYLKDFLIKCIEQGLTTSAQITHKNEHIANFKEQLDRIPIHAKNKALETV